LRRARAHDGVEDAEYGEEVTKDDETDGKGLKVDSQVAEKMGHGWHLVPIQAGPMGRSWDHSRILCVILSDGLAR
jgi:hypothetical protein